MNFHCDSKSSILVLFIDDQVIQKAARIRPCVQTLVERAGLLPWLALAAVNARDFIVSEQDGTETNDLEAMALEVNFLAAFQKKLGVL